MARPGTRKIQRYTAEFKLKAVKLTDIDGIQVKDVAGALDIHPFMLSRWRKEVRDGLIKADRRTATAAVVEANRKGGPLRKFRIVEEHHPDGYMDLDDIVSPKLMQEVSDEYKRTAGFDARTLNNRPSLSVRDHPAHR